MNGIDIFIGLIVYLLSAVIFFTWGYQKGKGIESSDFISDIELFVDIIRRKEK